ncbi:MAG: lysylphosphatidylglycerol synthase transmembrane domain-containing protein [Candidatus Limnocylindria bacterium]
MSRWTLVRWGIGIVILVALVLTLDMSAIGARLAAANLSLVVLAAAGLSSLHLLGAATWRELMRRLVGLRLAWWPTVRLYYAAQALGGFTPANIGSDAYRVIALRGSGEGVGNAVLPIVVQRATSYLAVSLVGAAALIVATRPAPFTVGVTIGALALSTVAIGLGAAIAIGSGRLRSLRERLPGPDEADRRSLLWAIAIGLGLGLVFHLAGVWLTYGLVLAVDPAAASLAAVAAVAIARVSLLIPVTPSGLGFQEAALALLFIGIGLPAESALAASLLARLSLVLTGALGALALLLPAAHLDAPNRPKSRHDGEIPHRRTRRPADSAHV